MVDKPFKKKYPSVVEAYMQTYYRGLSERKRRHYAAIEALKFDWGGRTYIGELLGLTQKTLRKGIAEVTDALETSQFDASRDRKVGGGRKFFLSKNQPSPPCSKPF
jgi:hypothetical protein